MLPSKLLIYLKHTHTNTHIATAAAVAAHRTIYLKGNLKDFRYFMAKLIYCYGKYELFST
jgi:hypothetical protein